LRDGSGDIPSLYFTSQDTLVSCIKHDQMKLTKFIAANFQMVFHSFDGRISEIYAYREDRFAPHMQSFCANLSTNHCVRFNPPLRQVAFFRDTVRRDQLLQTLALKSTYVTIPRKLRVLAGEDDSVDSNSRHAMIDWDKSTWKNCFDFWYGYVKTQESERLTVKGVVLKAVDCHANNPNKCFFIIQKKNGRTFGGYDAHKIEDSDLALPNQWIPSHYRTEKYRVELFDPDYKENDFKFVFVVNAQGSLSKLYCLRKVWNGDSYEKRSVFFDGMTGTVDEESLADHAFWMHGTKLFPKQLPCCIWLQLSSAYH
jgi:hypothetical protein